MANDGTRKSNVSSEREAPAKAATASQQLQFDFEDMNSLTMGGTGGTQYSQVRNAGRGTKQSGPSQG